MTIRSSTPDRESVSATRADDPPDYSVFFRREYPSVLRTVYLVVGDAGRAEELTQEAFIQLLRHWRKIATYDRPDAWVRRVAIRLAARHARRERLRSLLERRSAFAPEENESAIDLAGALRKLSAGQRTAIVLHYYEDQPVDQVALVMECSQNTVKSHLHRGRMALRTLLGEERGDLDGA
jgi:RNA polymerase sigma-70 factor (sigma-E family)